MFPAHTSVPPAIFQGDALKIIAARVVLPSFENLHPSSFEAHLPKTAQKKVPFQQLTHPVHRDS